MSLQKDNNNRTNSNNEIVITEHYADCYGTECPLFFTNRKKKFVMIKCKEYKYSLFVDRRG